jgi:uncharacterized protein (UPF0333 family)
MKQTLLVLIMAAILISGGAFWFISSAKKNSQAMPATTNSKNVANPGATEKSGTTTKVGKITGSDGKFYLQEAGQIAKEIESYVVDLSVYVGQTVTVSGQYSGDTLFVGSVK